MADDDVGYLQLRARVKRDAVLEVGTQQVKIKVTVELVGPAEKKLNLIFECPKEFGEIDSLSARLKKDKEVDLHVYVPEKGQVAVASIVVGAFCYPVTQGDANKIKAPEAVTG